MQSVARLYLELEVSGPGHDLHSGNFGGVVHNPLQALCEILAGLHDRERPESQFPVFTTVCEVGAALSALSWRVQAHLIARYCSRQMSSGGWGELGFSGYERLTLRPALTLNGVTGWIPGAGRQRCNSRGVQRPRSVSGWSPTRSPRMSSGCSGRISRKSRRPMSTRSFGLFPAPGPC